MADWVIDSGKNNGYPFLEILGEPQSYNFTSLFTPPKPDNRWTTNVNVNNGYPTISWQPPIPTYSGFASLFKAPKPDNRWVINSLVNDNYPFIYWQFPIPSGDYNSNRPYYRLDQWRKLLNLRYWDGSQWKRAYHYKFWNGTRWV